MVNRTRVLVIGLNGSYQIQFKPSVMDIPSVHQEVYLNPFPTTKCEYVLIDHVILKCLP